MTAHDQLGSLSAGTLHAGFLKSPDLTVVPVQFRPRAPIKSMTYVTFPFVVITPSFHNRRIVDKIFPFYPGASKEVLKFAINKVRSIAAM